MRFLLNFVSCCGADPDGHVVAPPTVPPLAKKPSSLVPASFDGNKHRRRVKQDGRPSLRTISEDDVVNVEEAKGSARPRNKKIGNFESTANSQNSRNTSINLSIRQAFPHFPQHHLYSKGFPPLCSLPSCLILYNY